MQRVPNDYSTTTHPISVGITDVQCGVPAATASAFRYYISEWQLVNLGSRGPHVRYLLGTPEFPFLGKSDVRSTNQSDSQATYARRQLFFFSLVLERVEHAPSMACPACCHVAANSYSRQRLLHLDPLYPPRNQLAIHSS